RAPRVAERPTGRRGKGTAKLRSARGSGMLPIREVSSFPSDDLVCNRERTLMPIATSLRRAAGISAAAVLVGLAGCGGGGANPNSVSSAMTPATVSGTVTINGKLASGGEISFDPTNRSRPNEGAHSAPIGKDGTYKVETLVGENQIRINTPETAASRDLSG